MVKKITPFRILFANLLQEESITNKFETLQSNIGKFFLIEKLALPCEKNSHIKGQSIKLLSHSHLPNFPHKRVLNFIKMDLGLMPPKQRIP